MRKRTTAVVQARLNNSLFESTGTPSTAETAPAGGAGGGWHGASLEALAIEDHIAL